MIFLLIALISLPLFSPITIKADCCNSSQRQSCCNNHCLDFEQTAKYFCYLKAKDLQLNTAYINNATIGTLRILANNTADGTLTAENIIINGDLNVDGTLLINGESPIASISQYGYFTRETTSQILGTTVGVNNFIIFNTNYSANGITNAAGVITFSEPGIYIVNFTAALNGTAQTSLRLVFDPTGAQDPVDNGQFVSEGQNGDYQVTGLVMVTVPTAGTTMGVINVSGGNRTIDPVNALPNMVASIQIAKLADL